MDDVNDNRIDPPNGEPAGIDAARPAQNEAAAQDIGAAAVENHAATSTGAPVSSEFSTPPARRSLLSRIIAAMAAVVVAALAWFIPGAGHLVLRRWQRAIVFFIAVGGLAVSGYLMRGNVFRAHSQDPFGTLGFVADACSGVFYLLSRAFETAGPNVSRSIGDYGTRFIAAAGIVNVLGVCDAYEIARGRRH